MGGFVLYQLIFYHFGSEVRIYQLIFTYFTREARIYQSIFIKNSFSFDYQKIFITFVELKHTKCFLF